MKILRFSAILLSFICIFTMFAACGKKDSEGDAGNSSIASSEASLADKLSTADVSFVVDGESVYKVVRAEGCDSKIAEAASQVFRAIKATHSVSAKNESDEIGDGAGVPEILIGETNRDTTAVAKELLLSEGTGRYNEYIICTVEEDIVIYGTSIASTLDAVKYFIDNYVSQTTVAGGINYLNATPEKYTDVAIFGKTNHYGVQLVRPIYNVSYVVQLEIDKLLDSFLEKTGYRFDEVNDNIASNKGNNTDGSGTLTPSEAVEYEIIVGDCVREGVKTFDSSRAYEIRIEDKKIYINGGSPYATALAVAEFSKILLGNTAVTSDMSVLSGDYEATFEKYDSSEYYYPTWKEDFNSDDIDNLGFWTCRWDEKTTYQDLDKPGYRGSSKLKNNYIKDGKVYMDATQDEKGYYGGMIDTSAKVSYQFGYLEISCLHPKGIGFWSALWTVSDGNAEYAPLYSADNKYTHYSETDIDECYGYGTMAYGNTFAWPTSYGNTIGAKTNHVKNTANSEDDRGFWMDFHTYGFEWLSKEKVAFTCDGRVFAEQVLNEDEQSAYAQPQWIKLSLAVGANDHDLTTDISEWKNTNQYITEYVYLYQKRGQKLFFGNGDRWQPNWVMQERQ